MQGTKAPHVDIQHYVDHDAGKTPSVDFNNVIRCALMLAGLAPPRAVTSLDTA
jgi:hypothetical protein